MQEASEHKNRQSDFLPDRIVHLHPTWLCNLACLHCYSDSGPHQKTGLDLKLLQQTLPLLKAERYNLISISGGEPLIYPHLLPLLDCAREHGFRVTMITNGLFPTQRIDAVVPKLDGLAISFDGTAGTHNRLRGRADAFERASATLAWLADKGYPVGAAISLTRTEVPELPDLVDHLVGLGAKALQIRPIALAGRAKTMVDASAFTPADQARLYMVVLALEQELAGQVKVHCDLAPVRNLWQQRSAYAALLEACNQQDTICLVNQPLAELVNPLVITETGILKPITYDFHPCFDVASIDRLSSETLSYYKQHNLKPMQMLIGDALGRLENSEGLIDWFDYCTRLSEEKMVSKEEHHV